MILLCKEQNELSAWTGPAVVIDVLCDSTALCALTAARREEIRCFASEKELERAHAEFPAAQVWSSSRISSKYPAQSMKHLLHVRPYQKAFVLLGGNTSQAVWALRNAQAILVGGFCNFQQLGQLLKAEEKDVLLVPASLFETEDAVEDVLCAEALRDFVHSTAFPKESIANFYTTLRMQEYVRSAPFAKENLKLATHLDGLPIVPEIRLSQDGSYGVCSLYNPAKYREEELNKTLYKTQMAMELQDMSLLKNIPSQTKKKVQEKPLEDEAKKVLSNSDTESSENTASPASIRISQAGGTFLASFPHKVVSSAEGESLPTEAAKKTLDLSDAPTASISKVNIPEKKENPTTEVPQKTAPEVIKTQVFRQQPAADPSKKAEQELGAAEKSVRKAIVLFSGGLDSTTCLYWALAQGYVCEALTVSYGQRHDREVKSAQQITQKLGVKHHLISLDLPWLQTSSLVNKSVQIPDVPVEQIPYEGIPSTYVPGRNLMFLSLAGSLLDSVGAEAIIAGPNAVDFSGYPDCTPIFFQAAADALNYGTKQGVSGGIDVLAPLMNLSKAEIVKLAEELHVPFELTWSCYAGGEKPCGHCDSCKLRAKGFQEAGVHDTSLD